MKKNQSSLLFVSQDDQNCEFIKTSLAHLFTRIVQAQNLVETSLKISNEKFKIILIDFACLSEQHARFVHNIAVNDKEVHILILGNSEKPKDLIEYQHSNIKFLPTPKSSEELQEFIDPYLYNLDNNSNIKMFSKGEVLIEKGSTEKKVYFVLSGSFFALDESQGQKVILGSIKKGEIVGMMSLLMDSPRTANVIAAEDASVSIIPKDTILASLSQQPFWVRALFKTLCNRLIEANKKIASLATK